MYERKKSIEKSCSVFPLILLVFGLNRFFPILALTRDDEFSTVWVDFSIPSIIPYRMFIRVRENYRENQTLHALKEKLRTVKRKYGKLIHEQKSEIFLSK